MTDLSLAPSSSLMKRKRAQKRFEWYGLIAIFISIGFLFVMLFTIFTGGVGAFTHTYIGLDLELSEEAIDPEGKRDPATLLKGNYRPIILEGLLEDFPSITERRDRQKLFRLLSDGASYQLADRVVANPDMVGKAQRIWLPASSVMDLYVTGEIDKNLDESLRQISNQEAAWIDQLESNGRIKQKINSAFFTNGDSREPELAGILGAFMGSFFSLLVCFLISFPIGIMTAVYLEEFARKSRFSDFIEVNINNLAAVPSIVFGLLGLSIFLNVFGLPRSTPLVGGMVLALMTLPTIIIASRASLRSVPPSVRQAALGLGASKTQTTFHHTVPLAMPGMLTGTIIGMAQALGETAPLLMIGMVAFVVDIPHGVVDTATSLPVQIFLWADSPEKGFLERTSAAIIVLLFFLIAMNLLAVILRRRLERRW